MCNCIIIENVIYFRRNGGTFIKDTPLVSMFRRSSRTKFWISVHVILPLLPFILEAVIRIVVIISVKGENVLNAFNWATYAMSVGFLCMFVFQSLATHDPLLGDDEVEQEIRNWEVVFLMLAITTFVLFGVIVYTETANFYSPNSILKSSSNIFKCIVVFESFYIYIVTLSVQKSFKLKARF